MPDNTIEWGQGAVNNTNDWGKAKANATNNFGAIYDDSPSLDTNITGSTGAVLSITYSASAFCEDGIDPTPTVSNNVGAGTFSSTTGLVFISTTTGQVDLSASTSGATYLITYTDTNAATATFSLTVNALDDASFAYSQSSYSPTDADPTPTITGVTGGTFSAGSGLVFVDSGSNTGSSTGEIDLSASTVASYTITYTTAGTCPNTSTQSVEIAAALAQVNNVYSMEFDGTNDYIDAGTGLGNSLGTYTGDASVSLWFKADTTTGNDGLFSMTAFDDVVFGNLRINIYNNELYFVSNGIGKYKTIPFTDTTSWHHLICVFKSGNITNSKIYLDGIDQTTTDVGTFPSSLSMTGLKTIIGAYHSINQVFQGKIDEVAIWNTALTAQEVQSIYNATETGKTADLNDLTTPPLAWYRM
jgi:hypothetical protein